MNKSVAVVDDDRIYKFTAERALNCIEQIDKIWTFENGAEALKYLQHYRQEAQELPDIILLDIEMPIMDGWAFLEAYQQLEPHLPKSIKLYMVSSSVDPRDHARAAQIQQVLDFIIKPIDIETFQKVLDRS